MSKVKEIRLAILIPSHDQWAAQFGMDLAMLVAKLPVETDKHRIVRMDIYNKKGSLLANQRQDLLERAINAGHTHALFIDSDQTFPADLAHMLLYRQKQVVACNVATKSIPSWPTARKNNGTVKGELVFTTPESTGLEEVWRVGTGVMLIDLNIFKREGMAKPWFPQEWNAAGTAYNGEDWGFCERLEKAGVKIYIDQDVSKEIGHIGRFEYHHKMIDPEKAKRVIEAA